MANISIGDLKWQNHKLPLLSYAVSNGILLQRVTNLSGYKGKATVVGVEEADLLQAGILCDLPAKNDAVNIKGKEVALIDYSIKEAIPRCELQANYLNSMLLKGADNQQDIYLDDIQRVLLSSLDKYIFIRALDNLLIEAAADSDVQTVAATPITDTATANAAIKGFITDLPAGVVAAHHDIESGDNYTIFVSSTTKAFLEQYYNVPGSPHAKDLIVEGYRVEASATLRLNEIFAIEDNNFILFSDDDISNNVLSVVKNEEISTDYLIGNMSFVGTYLSPYKIVLTDNF